MTQVHFILHLLYCTVQVAHALLLYIYVDFTKHKILLHELHSCIEVPHDCRDKTP